MKRVNIAELKNRLSHYLRAVRGGQAVLIYDRDRVIARIEAVRDGGDDTADWTIDLERRGILTPPARKLPAGWLAKRPHVQADVVGALAEERASGR